MKVSKPVLIFAIVMLLLSGYIFFFTGKKKPRTPVTPQNQAQQVQPPGQAQQKTPAAQQVPPQQATPPAAAPLKAPESGEEPKTLSVKVRADLLQETSWARNPFLLPLPRDGRKKESGQATRLLAIFQKGADRVAIIDHDVVRRGDVVGDEKVLNIGDDSVVLARGSSKRVLNLIRYEDAVPEEEPKTNATEKGK